MSSALMLATGHNAVTESVCRAKSVWRTLQTTYRHLKWLAPFSVVFLLSLVPYAAVLVTRISQCLSHNIKNPLLTCQNSVPLNPTPLPPCRHLRNALTGIWSLTQNTAIVFCWNTQQSWGLTYIAVVVGECFMCSCTFNLFERQYTIVLTCVLK